jgi:pyrroloquinoline-quinone synthase
VVTTHCLSAESQALAVDALSFKCDVLWSLMNAIDQAYPE